MQQTSLLMAVLVTAALGIISPRFALWYVVVLCAVTLLTR
jgi:hypothetical protein